jgi:carbamoyl-phosphate synthase large subunit
LPSQSNPEEVNVLFTSAGRRVELLRAFRRAYGKLNLPGQILATDIDPLAPALQEADDPRIVPRLDDPAYIPALLDIVRREKIAMVFPLIDPDIPILSAHYEEFQQAGARVMTPPPEGVETATDKWKTFQMYSASQIPVARSWLPKDFRVEDAEFPLIVKPRRGSAGKGVFKVENPSQLSYILSYAEDAMIQEYLPGPEITSDVICNREGKVWAVVNRRRIEIRSGEVAKGVTLWDERIARWCIEVAQAIRATGPITVQCMLRDGEPRFTEINARFGGGCPLGIAAGADYPLWYLCEAAGLDPEVPPLGSYRQGLYMTRFDDSHFFGQDEYDRLARRRI